MMNEVKTVGEPLVSVIIRTCGRPDLLSNALESIRKQSYHNIEVVIIEDGLNVSEKYISDNYRDLQIVYFSTGQKGGRCRAGNIGLEKASGEYLNFLDDDDILLPNHVSLLVEKLIGSEYKVAYSIAEEHQFLVSTKDGKRTIKRKFVRFKQQFNRLLLCYMNYFPIQSVMFERSLYEECGGFDTNSEMLEDWDFWLRMALKADFLFVPEITSVYYTPYKSKGKRNRDIEMNDSRQYFAQKHKNYIVNMSSAQICEEIDYVLNVYNKKKFLFYAQKVRNFLLYRDI